MRAGSSAMMVRRSAALIAAQAAISSSVRPQPVQSPRGLSSVQTDMQGDSIGIADLFHVTVAHGCEIRSMQADMAAPPPPGRPHNNACMEDPMSVSGLPFDDFRALVGQMSGPLGQPPELDRNFQGMGGLAALAPVAGWLAAWSSKPRGLAARPMAAIFAGTHQQESEQDEVRHIATVMQQMQRIGAGEAAIAILCRDNEAGLKALDLALEHPVSDPRLEPAMDERGCAATMAFGMEAIAGGIDLICLGDIGIGNTAHSLALIAAISGDTDGLGAVERQITDAQATAGQDPLETLRRIGGREHAALFGAIVAARLDRIPVVLDGLAAIAAAAVLHAMRPTAISHCMIASLPAEPLAARTAARCGLQPMLSLGDVTNEGCGAVLSVPMIRNAAGIAGLN